MKEGHRKEKHIFTEIRNWCFPLQPSLVSQFTLVWSTKNIGSISKDDTNILLALKMVETYNT